jgi:hypothetical protein
MRNLVSHTKDAEENIWTKMEVARRCTGLHNEELHNLNAFPNIIWVIKSERIRWTGHVPRMEEMRYTKF